MEVAPLLTPCDYVNRLINRSATPSCTSHGRTILKILGTPALATVLLSSVLAACGGGGSSSSGGTGTTTMSLSASGVAATGAALAGATVSIKCAAGSPTSTPPVTSATGSYTVSVSDAALPCVIKISKDGDDLYSLIESGAPSTAIEGGAAYTANVTPLTGLLLSAVSGVSASQVFEMFTAEQRGRLTAANVETGTQKLVSLLQPIVNLDGDNLLRGELVPAANGQEGNLADQKLDAIRRALNESDVAVAQLESEVVKPEPSLPAALANVPTAAASCPALRTGDYYTFEPFQSYAGAASVDELREVIRIDAAALQVRFTEDGDQVTLRLSPVAQRSCEFDVLDDPGITERLYVSRSGAFVSRAVVANTKPSDFAVIGLPVPSAAVPVGQLAGNFNFVGFGFVEGLLGTVRGGLTLDQEGNLAVQSSIVNGTPEPLGDEPDLQLEPVDFSPGVFVLTNLQGGAQEALVFAHQDPNGGPVTLFVVGLDGAPDVAIVRPAQAVPAPGPNGSRVNSVSIMLRAASGLPVVDVPTDLEFELLTFDAETKVQTRRRLSDNRVDTRTFDQPATGLIFRRPGSCTTGVGGPAVACAAVVTMPPFGTGLGITINAGSASPFFELGIN